MYHRGKVSYLLFFLKYLWNYLSILVVLTFMWWVLSNMYCHIPGNISIKINKLPTGNIWQYRLFSHLRIIVFSLGAVWCNWWSVKAVFESGSHSENYSPNPFETGGLGMISTKPWSNLHEMWTLSIFCLICMGVVIQPELYNTSVPTTLPLMLFTYTFICSSAFHSF